MKRFRRALAEIAQPALAGRGIATLLLLGFVAADAFARVGGGQSSGGRGGGGGDGYGAAGAILWLIFQLFRVLVYLTIEYPLIGIPLDILVLAGVIYFFYRRGQNRQPSIFSTGLATSTPVSTDAPQRTDGF